MKWHEVIVFLFISLSFLSPDFVLGKFYPKFEYTSLQINNLEMVNLKPNYDVHIKVTRSTEYGDRYKLFVIKKGSFNDNYSLKDYGISLIDQDGKMIVGTLTWNSLAKKDGIQTGDLITKFKMENLDRPNKAIVYPFALLFLFAFGYLNYRRRPSL